MTGWTRTPPTEPGHYWASTVRDGIRKSLWMYLLEGNGFWHSMGNEEFSIRGAEEYFGPNVEFWPEPIAQPETEGSDAG